MAGLASTWRRLQTGSGRRWRAQTRKKRTGRPVRLLCIIRVSGSAATFPTDGFTGRSAAPLGRAGRWPAMPTKVGIYQSLATQVQAGQLPRPVVPAAGRQCQPRLAATRAKPRWCRSVSRPARSCRPLAGNANQGWHATRARPRWCRSVSRPAGSAGRWPEMPTKVGIYQGLATQVQGGQLPHPVVPAAGRQCQPRLAATRARPRRCRSVSCPARSCRSLAGNANQGWHLPEPGHAGAGRSAAPPGRAGRWPAMPTKVGSYQGPGHAGAGRSAAPPGRAGRWPAMPTKVGIYQGLATLVPVGQLPRPVVPAAGRNANRGWQLPRPGHARRRRRPRRGV